jgi:hypothetical protein
MQRLPNFSIEQTMVAVNSPSRELRHSRAAQELIEEGRQLTRRCGPLSTAITARIQALPLEQLEALGLALLDFSGAKDLAAWLAVHAG